MHELEFTDNEIRIILQALDLYSRIWIGQYDHILWDLRWYRNCNQLDELDKTLRREFLDIRNIVLPGLHECSLNGSYGIFHRIEIQRLQLPMICSRSFVIEEHGF